MIKVDVKVIAELAIRLVSLNTKGNLERNRGCLTQTSLGTSFAYKNKARTIIISALLYL